MTIPYLTLTPDNLLQYYPHEEPLVFEMAGQKYKLPVVRMPLPTHMHVDTTSYRLDKGVAAYAQPIREILMEDERFFDGTVVRLDAQGADGTISVRPGSYFDAVATNFTIDHAPPGPPLSLRDYLHGQHHALNALAVCRLVNNIGMGCMVETADGMLIGQWRTNNVAIWKGMVSVSVGGGMEWEDVMKHADGDSTFLDACMHTVRREAMEELGISLKNIVFLGWIRELLRGGKPEFYFFARCDETMAQLMNHRVYERDQLEVAKIEGYSFHSDKVGNDDRSRSAFQSGVNKMLASLWDRSSPTFPLGVLLSSEYILARQG